jgi:hypothetical protein
MSSLDRQKSKKVSSTYLYCTVQILFTGNICMLYKQQTTNNKQQTTNNTKQTKKQHTTHKTHKKTTHNTQRKTHKKKTNHTKLWIRSHILLAACDLKGGVKCACFLSLHLYQIGSYNNTQLHCSHRLDGSPQKSLWASCSKGKHSVV